MYDNDYKVISWKIVFCVFGFIFVFANTVVAERMAVNVPKANIRSGPGEKYDILWTVEKYYPIIVIDKNEQWYKFKDFEGDVGWIYKNLLSNEISSIITLKAKCNIRSGPGTKYGIIFSAERGIPFKIIKRKDDWYHIIHVDGDKGWIHKSLVW